MLSLSSLAPRDVHTLWYTSSHPAPPSDLFPAPAPTASALHTTAALPRAPKRPADSPTNGAASVLTQLLAEEAALAARKTAIRRFGATWIRPPGVAKTYQAMVDEAAEKAEQEVLARREGEMLAMRAAMEREEEQQARLGAEGDGEDEGMGMERDLDLDLDDGVAEAMRAGDEDDDDDGEEDDDDDDGDEGVDEEEDEGAGETGTETETETEALEGVESTNVTSNILDIRDGQEHNLDDDVPSAGSYEHTDSELEDTESLVESSDHIPPPSSPAAAAAPHSTTSSPAPGPPSITQHPRHHQRQAAPSATSPSPPSHSHLYPRAALTLPSHATPESSEYAAANSLVRISASAARQAQARSTRNPAPFGLLAHALDGEDANDDSSLLLDGVDSSVMSAGLGLGMSMSSPIAAARRGRAAAAAAAAGASADGVGSEAEDALVRPGRWPGANRRAREG